MHTQVFSSPRICLHYNESHKSCLVYFADACEATLLQHVSKFQNFIYFLYFQWGYFPLKQSNFYYTSRKKQKNKHYISFSYSTS